jgi:MFS family permease
MPGVVGTTVAAARAVYPAMIFILCFEIATKLYKAPFGHYIVHSYGKEGAPIVAGTVSSAAYVLQLLSAPAWGRLADKGFPRFMLAAAVIAPLIPSIACLCVPASATERIVIVTFNVSTVLAGLCGSPLAVAFAIAKSLVRLKIEDGNSSTAARAMLLVMGCVPLGVLTGVVTENIITDARPKLAINTTRTLQEELQPLVITAVSTVAVMTLVLFLSGVLSSKFSSSLAAMNGGHGGGGDVEYNALDDDEVELNGGRRPSTTMRSRGDSFVDVLSRKVPAPSFVSDSGGTTLVEEIPAVVDGDDTCTGKCSRAFIVVRWLREPDFVLLALAFMLVEFGHEGFFSLHVTSFLRSFPSVGKDLVHTVLELGAGLNAFNILFLAPLFTYYAVNAYKKAIMAATSMVLCYSMWATGNLELTFVGEVLGLMSLMFKPSVTFMLTERLGSGSAEAGEAIGALHACGFVGAILGIICATVTVTKLGAFGFAFSALGPCGAVVCLMVDRCKRAEHAGRLDAAVNA